jgi:hypothetical protein
MSLSYI